MAPNSHLAPSRWPTSQPLSRRCREFPRTWLNHLTVSRLSLARRSERLATSLAWDSTRCNHRGRNCRGCRLRGSDSGRCAAAEVGILGTDVSLGAVGVGASVGAVEGVADYELTCGTHTLAGYLDHAGVGAAVDAFGFGAPEEFLFGGLDLRSHAADVGGWFEALKFLPGYIARSAL
jgi:hypothetical protein